MVIEIGIISLLVIALGFCWRLHKRLMAFRNVQSQIEPSYQKFSGLLGQINNYIQALRTTTETTSEQLQKHIPQGKVLKDDLDILIEHSNRVAKRLDNLIDQAIQAEGQLKKTVNITQLRYEEALKTPDKKENSKSIESRTEVKSEKTAVQKYPPIKNYESQYRDANKPYGLNSQLKNNIQGIR